MTRPRTAGKHPGLIERKEQIQLLRRCVAVVQPSLFEGWSTIIEDARIFGKRTDVDIPQEQNPERSVLSRRLDDPWSPLDEIWKTGSRVPTWKERPKRARRPSKTRILRTQFSEPCAECSVKAVSPLFRTAQQGAFSQATHACDIPITRHAAQATTRTEGDVSLAIACSSLPPGRLNRLQKARDGQTDEFFSGVEWKSRLCRGASRENFEHGDHSLFPVSTPGFAVFLETLTNSRAAASVQPVLCSGSACVGLYNRGRISRRRSWFLPLHQSVVLSAFAAGFHGLPLPPDWHG
jgi:hypothetical protein